MTRPWPPLRILFKISCDEIWRCNLHSASRTAHRCVSLSRLLGKC